MSRKNFYILLSTFYILLFLLPSLSFAHTPSIWPAGYWGAPLVSCSGDTKSSNPCISLCDLTHTFLHVVYFGMTLVVFVFTPIFFAWGGIMILISSGDPGKLQIKIKS